MPSYKTRTSPASSYVLEFTTPQALPGETVYLFGSNNDYNENSPVEGTLQSFSITSNVVTFKVARGFIANFSAGATVVVANVDSAYSYLDGTYTVVSVSDQSPATLGFSFTAAKTHANVGSTSLTSGTATTVVHDNTEHAEALTTGASIQCSLPSFNGQANNSPTLAFEVEFPSAPVSVDVRLQGALRDVESEYEDIPNAAITSASGGVVMVTLGQVRFLFVRANVAATSGGTNPSIIAKLVL